MAKITRKKLARGVKLLTDHIFTPLKAAQDVFTENSGTVETDQVEAKYAPMRINLSIPRLTGVTNAVRGPGGGTCFHGIPFMLPPLQEDLSFSSTPSPRLSGEKLVTVSNTAPELVLDEVIFSFDQRNEPAATISEFNGGTGAPSITNAGKVSYEGAERLNITLSIQEKRPFWIQGSGGALTETPDKFELGRTIWSGTIDAAQLSSLTNRLNPWVDSGIRVTMDPFKTYVFVIHAPELATGDTSNDLGLFSVEVSMKFLTTLIERDSGTDIQNIPTHHDGLRCDNLTHASLGVTGAGLNSTDARTIITTSNTPAAGDAIEANTAKGAQTHMATIDEFLRRKLEGGYKFDSNVPMLEERKETAAYTVLAVPLFNNQYSSGLTAGDFEELPYIDSSASAGSTGYWPDRRYIPIESPMTIHHILFTYSWLTFKEWDGSTRKRMVELPIRGTNTTSGSATISTLSVELGVGIGTGFNSEKYGYEQIASATLSNHNNWYTSAIDLMRLGSQKGDLPVQYQYANATGTSTTRQWNLETHAMDIVGSGSPSLNGMTSQGKPIFVGRANNITQARRNIGGAASDVGGAEQWIEVRGRIGDGTLDIRDGADGYWKDSMLLGSGGIWVYIIGKTHLV